MSQESIQGETEHFSACDARIFHLSSGKHHFYQSGKSHSWYFFDEKNPEEEMTKASMEVERNRDFFFDDVIVEVIDGKKPQNHSTAP